MTWCERTEAIIVENALAHSKKDEEQMLRNNPNTKKNTYKGIHKGGRPRTPPFRGIVFEMLLDGFKGINRGNMKHIK